MIVTGNFSFITKRRSHWSQVDKGRALYWGGGGGGGGGPLCHMVLTSHL